MRFEIVPWWRVVPYQQVISERDGSLHTVLNVDITRYPHVVTAFDSAGRITVRTVDPSANAYLAVPEEPEALAAIARHFTIEGMEQPWSA
jgi:hypothetical protein